jgi:hypothetical protein
MTHKKRHLADPPEILAATGRSIDEWASLLEEKGVDRGRAGEMANYLIDECKLQLFWAHTIAQRLADETTVAGVH